MHNPVPRPAFDAGVVVRYHTYSGDYSDNNDNFATTVDSEDVVRRGWLEGLGAANRTDQTEPMKYYDLLV